MNWLVLIVTFCLSVMMGAFLARLFDRSRTGWSNRRRLLIAASVLPCFILFASLVGVAWIVVSGPGEGENMQDLAVVVTLAAGGFSALVALLGGLAGASFAQGSKGP